MTSLFFCFPVVKETVVKERVVKQMVVKEMATGVNHQEEIA